MSEKEEAMEVLDMLGILICSSKEAENKSDTLVEGVCLDSFQWVLNEAAKIINRTLI